MATTLALYVHDMDPFAFGPIRWYGLSYALGFLIAFMIIKQIVHAGNSPLKPALAGDLVFAMVIGILLGGRLGYAVLYKPSLFIEFRAGFPFWDLFAIHEGGMSSHGGFVGIVVAALCFARRHKLDMLHVLDLVSFPIPLGLCLGRIANFINGELYGRACAETFALAVKFPQEMFVWSSDKINALLLTLPAQATTTALQSGPVSWIIRKIQSGDQQVINAVSPFLTPRHPSQLYQAFLEGLCVFLVLMIAWIRPQKPGVIFGICCAAYSLARIAVEFFRQPDEHIAHLEYSFLKITRGQWLSGLLLLAGVTVWIIGARKNAGTISGWRPQH
ncbi:MAG: prolipoprotein diacylglyceryl transferase [Phycisphaeraceae bacterium]|nr:prolipoprotein diacylglyceryl transferase [Phycisphaeraceae bacterium]|tara:strand:- start:1787 stop:2779 length:993 start_codon:yes stop_codon:yes gene_type:complete